ncbi:FecR protein [Nitrobacter sp. Nb-311A]|uniref:FecR family protein n=1 Tax=Nitrobacter sp. Nb-311A TaxID=314253 RepID=UPI00006865D4|nr:FecR family protein [Nitrobacter sp. Nb-311A]EAQ36110.1 FecR protein [Nitrobacter sp. Nb-311A]
MEHAADSQVSDDPDHVRIVEEAAVWFATMHGGKASGRNKNALKAWLAADPRHAEAYADINRLWMGAIELPGMKDRHLAARKALTRRRLGKAVIAGTIGLGAWRYLASYPFADYRTATGERRAVTLADGSTIDLAAETKISLAFTRERRGLTLHEGEAFFTVAKDAARPFVVEAGSGRTTALGTAFGVDYRDASATVTVTESAVDVTLGSQSAKVSAGSLVTYDSRHIGAPRQSETGTELAWREGRLVFTQAPLGQAVQALNRWRSGRIIVMSNALAQRPITLIVNLNRTETIVAQLAEAVPIRIVAATPYLTLLFEAG